MNNFLLIGDSHAAAIGRAAQAGDQKFVGGPIGSGREFFAPFFDVTDNIMRLTLPEAANHIGAFLAETNVDRLELLDCPLLSTIGFSPHFLAAQAHWELYQNQNGEFDKPFLESPLFVALVKEMLAEPTAFYHHLCGAGLNVFGVVAPQRIPELTDPQIFHAAQEQMLAVYAQLGVSIIDTRQESVGSDGTLLNEYCQPADYLHANEDFGALVLNQFAALTC